MYGTVAHFRAKPGTEQQLQQINKEYETLKVPGFVKQYVYRMDSNPNEYIMTVVFQDKASYVANAESPDQHQRFMKFRALLESDPEWHDGEIVYSM